MKSTQVNKSDAYKCIEVRRVNSWLGSAVGDGMDYVCGGHAWLKTVLKQFLFTCISFPKFYAVKMEQVDILISIKTR